MDVEVRIRALEEQMAEMRSEVRRDGDHIAQILAAIMRLQNTVEAGFAGADRRFEGVDRRLDKLDQQLDRIESKINQ